MIVANNLLALRTGNQLRKATADQGKVAGKLSSGMRINGAKDDAAGLSISEKMRAQIRGLNMAVRNAQDGISLIQTAEGALNESHSILQRMRELSVQAASDTYNTQDRDSISYETSRLIEELERITTSTQFNEKHLFIGSNNKAITFQVGANSTQAEAIQMYIKKTDIPAYGYFSWEASSLMVGLPGDEKIIDLSTADKARQFIDVTDKAIKDVSKIRSGMGALQNRLEHTMANLENASENLTASESRIRDMDMAKGMMEFVKDGILQQSAQAFLAQANQMPQRILQLLA